MTLVEQEDLLREIVRDGFNNGDHADVIKKNITATHVMFRDVNSVFKEIATELGYITDTKLLTNEIEIALGEVDWSLIDTPLELKSVILGVVLQVPGASVRRIRAVLKSFANYNDISLPSCAPGEIKTRCRVGVVAVAAVDYFNNTGEPTKNGLYNAIMLVVKNESRALANTKALFNMLYAVSNEISAHEAAAANLWMETT